jgi:hypothetical protein
VVALGKRRLVLLVGIAVGSLAQAAPPTPIEARTFGEESPEVAIR